MSIDDTRKSIQHIATATRVVGLDEAYASALRDMGIPIEVEALPENAQPTLQVVRGGEPGRSYRMVKSLIMLGRVPDVVDVVIDDDATSRHHAAIGYQGGEFVLWDLGSTNGTYVNAKPIKSQVLTNGTQFRIGETVFAFWRS